MKVSSSRIYPVAVQCVVLCVLDHGQQVPPDRVRGEHQAAQRASAREQWPGGGLPSPGPGHQLRPVGGARVPPPRVCSGGLAQADSPQLRQESLSPSPLVQLPDRNAGRYRML